MINKYLMLGLLMLLPFLLAAQVMPQEGSLLNYRIIGFSAPPEANAIGYTLEVANGICTTPASFKQNLITTIASKKNKIIAEVPSFGSQYTWRITYTFSGLPHTKSSFFHFTTGSIAAIDTMNSRLRVTTKNGHHLNSYILLNGASVMYDANGRAVWYMPGPNGSGTNGCDIKCTPQHTLTTLSDSKAQEIDYNGKVLWEGPVMHDETDTSTSIVYHHEFTRLANGHYMILGSSSFKKKTDGIKAKNEMGTTKDNKPATRFFPTTIDGIIYEFDSNGKVLWSWKSSEYYKTSDINTFFSDNNNNLAKPVIFGHENSFYFDEKEQAIYLSYVSFNRIIKISYPSGKILNTYGTIYKKDGMPVSSVQTKRSPQDLLPNEVFAGQHCCRKYSDGSLLFFNNNMNTNRSPKVMMFREPQSDTGKLQLAWEYTFDNELPPGQVVSGGGGSVQVLPDGSIFIFTNSPYSRALVVNKNKDVLWSATYETRVQENEWQERSSYRASMISRDDLEQLIWKSESTSPIGKNTEYSSGTK